MSIIEEVKNSAKFFKANSVHNGFPKWNCYVMDEDNFKKIEEFIYPHGSEVQFEYEGKMIYVVPANCLKESYERPVKP